MSRLTQGDLGVDGGILGIGGGGEGRIQMAIDYDSKDIVHLSVYKFE